LFEEDAIIGAIVVIIVIIIFAVIVIGFFGQVTSGDKCMFCGQQVQANEGSTVTMNVQGLYGENIPVRKRVCRNCTQGVMDEQEGICPYYQRGHERGSSQGQMLILWQPLQ
jgi:hypothetical protein